MCRFIVDDKGSGILVAFGLPPFETSENGPLRGVKCGLAIHSTMELLSIGCSGTFEKLKKLKNVVDHVHLYLELLLSSKLIFTLFNSSCIVFSITTPFKQIQIVYH